MISWPKIPLGIRLFTLFFILVLTTAHTVTKSVVSELKPSIRQVTEETLIDMTNLLAAFAEEDLANGRLTQSRFSELLTLYGRREQREYLAKEGKTSNHRIYITDRNGIVVADSWQMNIGSDFSQWNDVYLTLRGKYGARTTAEDLNDPLSTVMHVAAPIIRNGDIIGSVTVAKANRSVQPFIDKVRHNVLMWVVLMSALVLLLGALFAWRIHSALNKLENYADKMGRGEKVNKPTFRIFYEYRTLSNALENMRNQLDGKQYVEQYVQTLTHELKSPLSAIRGASEILQLPLAEEKVGHFAGNIERESHRMQSLIDKLLELARLEKLPELTTIKPLNLKSILSEIIQSSDARLSQKQIKCLILAGDHEQMLCDHFLLKQALFNLMDNALDFSPDNGEIHWQTEKQDAFITISIFNTGPHIPDYALPRLTERFYSLPRVNKAKSTGLGLNFVEQIAKLHHGRLTISNVEAGVKVTLHIPTP